jgi:23S rRNA (uracil1939-C5)-methyltransferase
MRKKSLKDSDPLPPADRIPPKCTHFSQCGGCRWQHIPYEKQLTFKQLWVQDALQPHLDPLSSPLLPIVPCSPPWNYRNKMEFSFSNNTAGDRFLGLMLANGRGKVLNLEECHLCNPWMINTLHAARDWWAESGLKAYFPPRDQGSLRTLTLREGIHTGDRMVILLVSGNPEFAPSKENIEKFTAAIRAVATPPPSENNPTLSIFLRIQQIKKGEPTQFFEMQLYGPEHIREVLHVDTGVAVEKLEFLISPMAFFQPNTRQAEKLYSRAIQLASISSLPKNSLVYDLYCGTGTLGIAMAKSGCRVVGIEIVPEAILDARMNAERNGLHNIEFIQGDVGKVLAQRAEKNERPDLVLVDPPRVGLDPKAIEQLLQLNAPKIVYVSCNPISQAENLEKLIDGGYVVETGQPVDQFPQTVHIENILVLTKR